MLTSEERIEELHLRMRVMEHNRNRRQYYMICSAACLICFAAVILLAVNIARITIQSEGKILFGSTASIFAENGMITYIIVAILAFCLGAFFTIFCFFLKKRFNEREKRDDRNQ